MIHIRPYDEINAVAAGELIADTFGKYNLAHVSALQKKRLMGPFHYAQSDLDIHRKAISDAIEAPIVLIAETNCQEGKALVGILRGGYGDRLHSLFVHEDYQRQGIGRRLVRRFEALMVERGSTVIRLAATPYAVPFYLTVGYKRSTGWREMKLFDAEMFRYQPMRKVLVGSNEE